MEHLWAPWRMAYIDSGAGGEPEQCIFCTLPKHQNDEESLIVYRGKSCFVVLNLFPYNNGHLMVVPYAHVATLEGFPLQTAAEMMDLAGHAERILREYSAPHGFNLGINLGRVAGAGVKDHLHLHLVPRWNGDTNFMPVIGDTKVMPQDLKESYRQLAPEFSKLNPQ